MKWNSTLFRRLKFTEAQYRTHLRLRYQEIPMSSDQTWNPQRYAEHAHFVPALGQPLLDLLNVKAGERILDLACGDGVLSKKITDVGGIVVGVDSSAEMMQAARKRGIDARLMDAYDLKFDSEFDAVFCNASLHWMKRDPDAVIAGVRRALKPAGRFAAEMGGHGNVAAITVALFATLQRHGVRDPASASPWYYPTVDEYRGKLERAGFRVEYMELIPRPTPLPTSMKGWVETFAMPLFRPLPESERESALNETVEILRPVLCDAKGRWTADYVRLRFLAFAR
jgi:trans-aconitate methyltransferase